VTCERSNMAVGEEASANPLSADPSSVLGVFLRRCIAAFDSLPFEVRQSHDVLVPGMQLERVSSILQNIQHVITCTCREPDALPCVHDLEYNMRPL